MKARIIAALTILLGAALNTSAQKDYDGRYGWPEQLAPKSVYVVEPQKALPEAMLLESLSGLAAQSVNEGKYSAMVWVNVGNPHYKTLFEKTTQALDIKNIQRIELWDLVKQLKKDRVIKGYVLYSVDKSPGNAYSRRQDRDESSNIATVYGSVLKGVLIDQSLEPKAIQLGLKKLKDCRGISYDDCFTQTRDKLSNSAALAVDPKVPNVRDYAMAHKLMLYYDTTPFSAKVLEWVRPMSPILGWNCGHEDQYTGEITRWGHYNTASNWCNNLVMLSAGAKSGQPLAKAKSVDPKTLDYDDSRSYHSYVMSDGDNMQWTIGNFIHSPNYFGNPAPEKDLISWSLCPINLSVISPMTWNQLAQGSVPGVLLEYGGGYQYPDQFAVNRPNRKAILREFAQRLNYHLTQLNVTVFGFICKDVDGDDAKEAYEIFAQEMDNLTGMIAVQYAPYELEGEIQWFKNRKGIDIPVFAAKYSIWDVANPKRPRGGTPEYVSSLINRDVMWPKERSQGELNWTIVHAWSRFGPDNSSATSTSVGARPTINSIDGLISSVQCIPIEEMLWRIRMRHNPEQTKAVINGK